MLLLALVGDPESTRLTVVLNFLHQQLVATDRTGQRLGLQKDLASILVQVLRQWQLLLSHLIIMGDLFAALSVHHHRHAAVILLNIITNRRSTGHLFPVICGPRVVVCRGLEVMVLLKGLAIVAAGALFAPLGRLVH